MPPVISVSHPEEGEEGVEVDVEVEEGGEKEEASQSSQSGGEEPSTSAEHTKEEVSLYFHFCMDGLLTYIKGFPSLCCQMCCAHIPL